jgi:polyphosphate kinase
MRNADLTIDEDEAEDLLKEIEKQLKKRQWGEAIRLEIAEDMDPGLLEIIRMELIISKEDIYKVDGPLRFNVSNETYMDLRIMNI